MRDKFIPIPYTRNITPRSENIPAVVYNPQFVSVLEPVTHVYIIRNRVARLYVAATIVQHVLFSFYFLCIVSFYCYK